MTLAAARGSAGTLRATFDEVVVSATVWRNMPPAFVYVCRRPVAVPARGPGRPDWRLPPGERGGCRAAAGAARCCGWPRPALPVLAAEPLYVLVDTAVVGRLGAVPLAGLAVAARAVRAGHQPAHVPLLRHDGAHRAAASAPGGGPPRSPRACRPPGWRWPSGVLVSWSGSWSPARSPGRSAAAPDGRRRRRGVAADRAVRRAAGAGHAGRQRLDARRAGHPRPLRYVLAGNVLSAVLCPVLVHGSAAGPGWAWSARRWRTWSAQAAGAALFLGALVRERRLQVGCARSRRCMRAQLGAGPRPARCAAWRSRPASCPRRRWPPGSARPAAAAHQIVLQLWTFQALVLDAVAIAAQSLVGAALGAPTAARPGPRGGPAGHRATGWCSGWCFGVVFARAGRGAAAGVHRRPGGARPWCRWPGGSSSRCSRSPGVVFAARRGAARRRRRGVPAHLDAARPPSLGVPAADLGLARRSAGGWPGSGGAGAVHGGPAGRRADPAAVRALGGDRRRPAVVRAGACAGRMRCVTHPRPALGPKCAFRHRRGRSVGGPGGGQEAATDRGAVASGLVVVDKPAGLTSHDVVARLRRILRHPQGRPRGHPRPDGHRRAGLGVGRGTKLLGHLALDTKAYTATIRLGAATTTDDAEGEIARPRPTPAAVDRRRDRAPGWPR